MYGLILLRKPISAFVLAVILSSILSTLAIKSGVHQCVHITRKISKIGDGSTASSCLSCDPAQPTCYAPCQAMIDQLYHVCDNVCLPFDYYYDAKFQIEGCWSSAKPLVKIAVERCGCNTSSRLTPHTLAVLFIVTCAVVLVFT